MDSRRRDGTDEKDAADAIVKLFECWPSGNEDFETFNKYDRKDFELILDEFINVIKNEDN